MATSTISPAGPITGTSSDDTSHDSSAVLSRFMIAMVWLMPIMAFTMPTTSTMTDWQPLDTVKLIVLAIACVGGWTLLWFRRDEARLWTVVDPLVGLYIFLVYTIISVLWSPLPSVTIAQSGSLTAMLFLTTIVAMVTDRREMVSIVLKHMTYSFLVFSGIVLVAYLIDPEASGLDRQRIHSGGDGLIHPTASGATASLGLLLVFLSHVIGRYRWAKPCLAPAVVLHGAVLLLSNSRMAVGMAVITIGGVMFYFANNRQRASAIFAAAVLAMAFIVIDPGFDGLALTADAGASFVSRGQTADQIQGVSGRSEMWAAVWKEFGDAMVLGHGYFVTSSSGSLNVWNESHNYTAHNLALQILVSTGGVGFVIFSLSLLQVIVSTSVLRLGDPVQRRVWIIAFVFAVWFVGWSQLADAFLGPIRPESILFFSVMGIAIGQATAMTNTNDDQPHQSSSDRP